MIAVTRGGRFYITSIELQILGMRGPLCLLESKVHFYNTLMLTMANFQLANPYVVPGWLDLFEQFPG